jgi:hypothetical protein
LAVPAATPPARADSRKLRRESFFFVIGLVSLLM